MDAGAAFVASSIENQLGVRPEHVTAVLSGSGEEVFEAALADRTVLFKADRPSGPGRVVLEAWAHQRVRELGAPAPRVLATDLGRETYPRNFIIIEKIGGVPLSDADLEPGARRRLIRQAGWAIRAVHEIGIPGFGLLEENTYLRTAQVQGEFDSWEEFLNRLLDMALPRLRASGVISDAQAGRVEAVVAGHFDYYELGPVGHLLHGRFDPAHVLVDNGEIAGIVGFGDRCSGDPAWDLGGFLADNAAEIPFLLAGYDADKERAAVFEMTIPLYGGLRALLAAGRAHDGNRPTERAHLMAVAGSSLRFLEQPGVSAF